LNGLIFYANIVKANEYILLPHEQTNPLTVFKAWLNLDLGIETCFIDGLSAYSKTWLQFAFLLYIWSIIILAKYSDEVAKVMGPTMYKDFVLRAGGCSDEFIEYMICPSCHSVYAFEDCIESVGREKRPKTCSHVPYPNHPHRNHRQPCGASLLKTVQTGRSNKLVPIKVIPYMPLSKSLKLLAKRLGFLAACEKWRDRRCSIPNSYIGDVYDGQIWYDFNSTLGHSFLSTPMSYLVTLNVDWFQPFSHTQYSVGAMYLTIQNLPRNIRCKEQNIILVRVMPGPVNQNWL